MGGGDSMEILRRVSSLAVTASETGLEGCIVLLLLFLSLPAPRKLSAVPFQLLVTTSLPLLPPSLMYAKLSPLSDL